MLVALLGADMERDADRIETGLERVLQHLDRHGRLAAELARQRPFGADTIRQDAAEHLRAWGRADDLVHFGLAIDREQANAEIEATLDVAVPLDRVAVGDAIRRGARSE